MGFRSVLVDEVVKITRGPTGPRVAGETPYGDQVSTAFKGRLSDPTPQEIRRDRLQFVEYVRDLTMMTGMKDRAGAVLDLEADDRVRVDAGPFAGTYDIKGSPTPIRKKRRQIGWWIALKETRGRVG